MIFRGSHNPRSVAFALITYFPKWYSGELRSIKHTDKLRGDIALEFVEQACKKGYAVVVVDGKSAKTFYQQLSRIQGVVVQKRRSKGRSPNKRQALRTASSFHGIKAIVLTEPEKLSLLTDCIDEIVKPILKDEAMIVVPKREPKLFKETYPDYMYESEVEGNSVYNEALRSQGLLKNDDDWDLFFGPRVIKNDKKVLSLFMKKFEITIGKITLPLEYFNTEELSNVQYFPIILALKKKLHVVSVEVPFKYPQIQKENEEFGQREMFIEKRRMQRLSLLVELIHFLSFLEGKKTSKMKVEKKS